MLTSKQTGKKLVIVQTVNSPMGQKHRHWFIIKNSVEN